MPAYYSQRRGAAPRRLIFAAISAVSFFILVVFAVANRGSSSQFSQRFAAPLKDAERPDNFLLAKARAPGTGDKYLLGVGKADITGPVVEINFAGYADSSQVGTGLRQRIYSRAFIVGEVGNPQNRFIYLTLDIAFGDTAVRNGILEGIAKLGSSYSMYKRSNVAVTGTHSHSGPGAWMNYLLPQITSLGFDKQGYQAIVDGAVLSVKRAHESLQEVGGLLLL